MLWENLREDEFESAIERSGGLCAVVLGCLEKHGQHLPLGTDYMNALDIAVKAAEMEEAVIFRTGAWLGEVSCFHAFKNPENTKLRGCIGISQATLLMILKELCDEIYRNGFSKILIINGHGGNDPLLKLFLRTQSYENKEYATLLTSAYAFKATEPKRLIATLTQRKKDFPYIRDEDIEILLKYKETGYGGGHADMRETAMMLDGNPSLVREDRYDAESGISTKRSDRLLGLGVDFSNSWLYNFPSSYEAYAPYGATAEIGRAMKQISAERLSEIFKAVKEEDAPLLAAKMGK